MLCSSCSEVVRPVVAIDIDGTLGYFHFHFINFALDYIGKSRKGILPQLGEIMYRNWYDGNGPFREWFCSHFGIELDVWYDIKLAYRQGGMKRSMPIRPGVQDFIRTVMKDAEVWLATVRPHNRLDNVDPDTREWLRRNEVPFDHLLYDDDKYDTLAKRIDPTRVVAVLDDLPEMCYAAREAFGPDVPILMKTDYNLGVLDQVPFVATNYHEALFYIQRRITLWHRHHEKGN